MNPQLTPEALKELLTTTTSPDAAMRLPAWERLLALDASALLLLADLMASTDAAEAKAAKTAMERLAHSLLTPPPGQDRPDGKIRARVADYLTEIARSARPRAVRAHALYLLGFAGEPRHEKALADLEKDKDVGEDARMARKRIQSARY